MNVEILIIFSYENYLVGIFKLSGKLLDQGIKSFNLDLSSIFRLDKAFIKYVKYFFTISLLAFAVSIILYIILLAFAPFSVLQKSQFLRPIIKGFIALSEALLSISNEPSSKNILKFGTWFFAYSKALPNALCPKELYMLAFINSINSSIMGADFSSLTL